MFISSPCGGRQKRRGEQRVSCQAGLFAHLCSAQGWVARYQNAHPTQTETLSSDLLHYEVGRLMRQMTNRKHNRTKG